MTDHLGRSLEHLMTMYPVDESSRQTAWARTTALSELVRILRTNEPTDVGVETLEAQLRLAAIITRDCDGDLEDAAAHHDRLASDITAVQPDADPWSPVRNAARAHRMAAAICRGDHSDLRLFASPREDGIDRTAALRLPPAEG
jgi:hypothetical protein